MKVKMKFRLFSTWILTDAPEFSGWIHALHCPWIIMDGPEFHDVIPEIHALTFTWIPNLKLQDLWLLPKFRPFPWNWTVLKTGEYSGAIQAVLPEFFLECMYLWSPVSTDTRILSGWAKYRNHFVVAGAITALTSVERYRNLQYQTDDVHHLCRLTCF